MYFTQNNELNRENNYHNLNLYAYAFCRPLINNVMLLGFSVILVLPQGYSLSGVLFNVVMIPLLTKIDYLPLHTIVRPYQWYSQNLLKTVGIFSYNNIASAYADDVFSSISIDLSRESCHKAIKAILIIY